jgi:hypothetical protein
VTLWHVALVGAAVALTGAAATPAVQTRSLSAAARLIDLGAKPHIGDVLVLEVDVTGESADHARLSGPPNFGPFEIVGDAEALTRRDDDGRTHAAFRYRLQPFLTGQLEIPQLTFESEAGIVQTNAVDVAI